MPFPSRTVSRALRVAALLLITAAAAPCAWGAAAGSSKNPRPDAPPTILRTPAGTTEIGTLQGTGYRIDVPTAWNHALVVYFHGYSEGPYTYRITSPLNEQVQPIFDRGYAVIQSAYSTPGWAVAEAYPETELLRLYFLKQYGKPAEGKAAKSMETIVVGGSMGGALVTAELEQNPKPFAGGLSLCGSVGPTDLAFQRRFAWRAAFDFYFPGLLPTLVPGPGEFSESAALRNRVAEALRAKPEAASALRNLTGLHTDREVADAMVYFTYVIADIQRRAGGNAFDNRDFLYTGTAPGSSAGDNALNDGVRRYSDNPVARQYLIHHYTPNGHLTHPLLALHTTYDPRIPGNTLAVYDEQVALADESANFVQQYVRRDGHCTFTQNEVGRTFDELIAWIHGGARPAGGALPPAARTVSSR